MQIQEKPKHNYLKPSDYKDKILLGFKFVNSYTNHFNDEKVDFIFQDDENNRVSIILGKELADKILLETDHFKKSKPIEIWASSYSWEFKGKKGKSDVFKFKEIR